jgi:hypothetical protein
MNKFSARDTGPLSFGAKSCPVLRSWNWNTTGGACRKDGKAGPSPARCEVPHHAPECVPFSARSGAFQGQLVSTVRPCAAKVSR